MNMRQKETRCPEDESHLFDGGRGGQESRLLEHAEPLLRVEVELLHAVEQLVVARVRLSVHGRQAARVDGEVALKERSRMQKRK